MHRSKLRQWGLACTSFVQAVGAYQLVEWARWPKARPSSVANISAAFSVFGPRKSAFFVFLQGLADGPGSQGREAAVDDRFGAGMFAPKRNHTQPPVALPHISGPENKNTTTVMMAITMTMTTNM